MSEDICLLLFIAPTTQSPIPALGASNWGAFNVSAHMHSAISLCKYIFREKSGGVLMPNVYHECLIEIGFLLLFFFPSRSIGLVFDKSFQNKCF